MIERLTKYFTTHQVAKISSLVNGMNQFSEFTNFTGYGIIENNVATNSKGQNVMSTTKIFTFDLIKEQEKVKLIGEPARVVLAVKKAGTILAGKTCYEVYI